MTPAERTDPAIIDGGRRLRIADGSGTTTSDVNALLKQFKEMQKMMKGIGKGAAGGAMGGIGSLLGRSPRLSPQAMAELAGPGPDGDLAALGGMGAAGASPLAGAQHGAGKSKGKGKKKGKGGGRVTPKAR